MRITSFVLCLSLTGCFPGPHSRQRLEDAEEEREEETRRPPPSCLEAALADYDYCYRAAINPPLNGAQKGLLAASMILGVFGGGSENKGVAAYEQGVARERPYAMERCRVVYESRSMRCQFDAARRLEIDSAFVQPWQ